MLRISDFSNSFETLVKVSSLGVITIMGLFRLWRKNPTLAITIKSFQVISISQSGISIIISGAIRPLLVAALTLVLVYGEL